MIKVLAGSLLLLIVLSGCAPGTPKGTFLSFLSYCGI
jgi:hypothetical protein